MSGTLPVYRVKPEDSSEQRLVDLAERIFDLTRGFEISKERGRRRLRGEGLVVELHRASGLVWAANEAQLWNPSLKPKLLAPDEAVREARRWAEERGLLPKLQPPFAWGKPHVGGTHYAMQQGDERHDRQLDVQVSFPVVVGEIPVTGGGADVTVILGNEGRVIGFSGGWRQAERAFDAKQVDRKVADELYQKLMRQLKLESFEVELAYYAAPPSAAQEFLYPVYVYQGYTVVRERRMALRQVLLAATEFGPALPKQIPQPKRPKIDLKALSAITTKSARERRSLANNTVANPFEAGTSWIGLGLPGCQGNAQGFVDEWQAAGWKINFNHGDENALESDWHQNDDTWVDDVDFVFYAGHADQFGWILSGPDLVLDAYEVGVSSDPAGDLWGQKDLEWAIIAACGPLQDDIVAPGSGSVLTRWGGAFNGLHILMGFGSLSLDNSDEGRKVAQYAKGGCSIIDAWFRAAKEVQPTTVVEGGVSKTVWVGAMWASQAGADPFTDRAWGCGSVSANPAAPTSYHCMWTTC